MTKKVISSILITCLFFGEIKSQIFTGLGGMFFLTHSNHPMIFKVNSNTTAMRIEIDGNVTFYNNIVCNGLLNVNNIYTNEALLKIKSQLATQIMNKDDDLLFECNDVSINMLRSSKILTEEFNTNLTIENITVGKDYSSLFLKANTVEAQIYAFK